MTGPAPAQALSQRVPAAGDGRSVAAPRSGERCVHFARRGLPWLGARFRCTVAIAQRRTNDGGRREGMVVRSVR